MPRVAVYAAAFAALTSSAGAQGLVTVKDVSYDMALVIAQTALESCRAQNFKVGVSVVDRGGHVLVTLRDHGAVSEETARAMAEGAARATAADVAVSITGIAGPGGGTPEKPVGTVCFGLYVAGSVRSTRAVMVGDRDEIRRRAAQAALNLVRKALQSPAEGQE